MTEAVARAEAVRTLVSTAGRLARFCDRSEHNESADRSVIVDAGAALRLLGCEQLGRLDTDVIGAYASRLAQIEDRNPLSGAGLFEADDTIRTVKTWRELQRGQARHDSVYHPDVNGMPKIDQLRHYTLHLAKLAWILQDSEESVANNDALTARMTDILIFGVKLASVCGQALPDEQVYDPN